MSNKECPMSKWRQYLAAYAGVKNFDPTTDTSPEPTIGHWTFLVGHWTLLVRNVQCPRGVLSWGLVVAYCHKVNFQGGAGLEISCCLLL